MVKATQMQYAVNDHVGAVLPDCFALLLRFALNNRRTDHNITQQRCFHTGRQRWLEAEHVGRAIPAPPVPVDLFPSAGTTNPDPRLGPFPPAGSAGAKPPPPVPFTR